MEKSLTFTFEKSNLMFKPLFGALSDLLLERELSCVYREFEDTKLHRMEKHIKYSEYSYPLRYLIDKTFFYLSSIL